MIHISIKWLHDELEDIVRREKIVYYRHNQCAKYCSSDEKF
jgi:hypothetical protein